MPRISIAQIDNYSVGITDDEKRIAQSLLNRKRVTVDPDNVQVFEKLTILPNCEELTCNYMGIGSFTAITNLQKPICLCQ